MCRFTAFLAVDTRVVTDGGTPHRVTQPVELPSGWERADAVPPVGMAAMPMAMTQAGPMMPGAPVTTAMPSPVQGSGPAGAERQAREPRGFWKRSPKGR